MNQPGTPQPPQNPYGPAPDAAPSYGGFAQPAGEQPVPPGPPRYQPQGTWGPPPGAPGAPPAPNYGYRGPQKPAKSNAVWWIVGAAAVAFVLLVGTVLAVVAMRSDDPVTASGEGVVAPASSDKPSDTVRGYLEALGAGDADRALSFVSTVPTDKTFLTSEALKAAQKKGAISDIDVPEVDDTYVYKVPASYTINGEKVSEDFAVKQVGGTWQVDRAFMELDLTYAKKRTLPMLINGTEVTSNKAMLFPGSYEFTTSSEYVTYGETPNLEVTGPSAYFQSPRLSPTLTQAGEDAARKAIKTALDACITKRELKPAGCPNQIRLSADQKVNANTIRWGFKKDPVAELRLSLDYQNPSLVTANVYPDFSFRATGTQGGRSASFTEGFFNFRSVDATVDLTRTPLTAKLG